MSPDVPGAPKDLRVTDITKSTMRLIWKLPDNDGGERIKSYFIEKRCVNDKALDHGTTPPTSLLLPPSVPLRLETLRGRITYSA